MGRREEGQSTDAKKRRRNKPPNNPQSRTSGTSHTIKRLTLINVNARSVLNKTEALESLLVDYEPDIVAITETWLSPAIFDHEIAPPNYTIIRKDRPSRGGGVALLIKNCLRFVLLPEVNNAEAVFCKLLCDGTSIVTGCVYRSPSSDSACLSAIQKYMQRHVHQSRIILAGDFNLADLDWSTMHHTSEASEVLIDLMLNFNLHQLVTRPTRVQGSTKNILDLIFLSNHFSTSQAQIDIIEGISDHSIPMCTFQLDHCITTLSTVKSYF